MGVASQESFKAEFRASIPADYSGVRHGLTICAIGALVITACLLLMRSPVSWLDLSMIPLVIVGWNLVEWWVHKYVLHYPRKHPVARALYNRHTLTHHQFFTRESPVFADHRDYSIVFFPVFALPAILVLALPFALAAWLVVSLNAALLVLISVTGIYLLFEAMHFCAHAPENRLVRNLPLVNTMRRHHIAHHDPQLMMSKNMNFTLPLFDWMLGTSDLDRGLLGTTFNGYSTRHVRKSGRAASNEPGSEFAPDSVGKN